MSTPRFKSFQSSEHHLLDLHSRTSHCHCDHHQIHRTGTAPAEGDDPRRQSNDYGLIASRAVPQPQGITSSLHSSQPEAVAASSRKARPEGAGTAPSEPSAPWLLVASLAFSCSLLSLSCVWSSGAGSRVWVSVAFLLSVFPAGVLSPERCGPPRAFDYNPQNPSRPSSGAASNSEGKSSLDFWPGSAWIRIGVRSTGSDMNCSASQSDERPK